MSNAAIPVSGTNASLQTYRNTIGGAVVDSEAVTPTDKFGVPIQQGTISQSGSQFFEGIRDDISLIFSRDQGAAAIARLINPFPSGGGTVTQDTTEGRAVFAVPATPGKVAYFESDKTAVYESGHMILGGQTIEVSALPTGNGKIEWGFGEDDGSGNILNGIGMGVDAHGAYTFRIKASTYAAKSYADPTNSAFAVPVGNVWENPIAGFSILFNNIMGPAYEWYGVASPQFFIADANGFPQLVHTSQTAGKIHGTTIPEPKLPLFVRIQNDSVTGQALSVASGCWRGGVLTNKTVLTALNPTLSYVDQRSGGNAPNNSTTTLLGSNGTFTGAWENVDQFIAVSAIINCLQGSATGGVQFQFKAVNPASPDTPPSGAATPDYISPLTYFGNSVGQSFRVDKPAAKWFRMVYVNGTTAQSGTFVLSVNYETSSLSTDIQIEAPNNVLTQTLTIGTAAQRLDNTALIGRLSWETYSWATNTNNQRVFVGFDNTVTAAGGANPGRPIENGADWKMDLSLARQVWCIASAAGMVVTFTQVGK